MNEGRQSKLPSCHRVTLGDLIISAAVPTRLLKTYQKLTVNSCIAHPAQEFLGKMFVKFKNNFFPDLVS